MEEREIVDLPLLDEAELTDTFPVTRDGLSRRLSLFEVFELLASDSEDGEFLSAFAGNPVWSDVVSAINTATVKTALADDDKFMLSDSEDGAERKSTTLANLISSIFKTGRTIADVIVQASTFRIKNAGGFSPIFDLSALTANRNVVLPNADVNLKSFTSAQQTISNAGSLTIPHPLGVTPKIIGTSIVCVTAEAGHTAGDTVFVAPCADNGTSIIGANISADATNIYVRFPNVASAYVVAHKTTGARTVLTNANWKLVLEARP